MEWSLFASFWPQWQRPGNSSDNRSPTGAVVQAVSSAPDKALKPKVSKSESLTECCRRTLPSLSDPQVLLDSAKGTNGLWSVMLVESTTWSCTGKVRWAWCMLKDRSLWTRPSEQDSYEPSLRLWLTKLPEGRLCVMNPGLTFSNLSTLEMSEEDGWIQTGWTPGAGACRPPSACPRDEMGDPARTNGSCTWSWLHPPMMGSANSRHFCRHRTGTGCTLWCSSVLHPSRWPSSPTRRALGLPLPWRRPHTSSPDACSEPRGSFPSSWPPAPLKSSNFPMTVDEEQDVLNSLSPSSLWSNPLLATHEAGSLTASDENSSAKSVSALELKLSLQVGLEADHGASWPPGLNWSPGFPKFSFSAEEA